jgi:predicted PhzF superfamily epimerase YddE/YHI9
MPEIKSYRYSVVDVFTADALEGNPLEVFVRLTYELKRTI